RLTERQYGAMPAKKGLLRETYQDGVVTMHNAVEKKVVSEHKLALSAAQAPDLTPRTKDLVVLSMPLRTRQHIWNTRISGKWNGSFGNLDEEAVIALIAADCA